MRVAMLILLASPFAVAAPVPKRAEKPAAELKLSADPLVLEITIQNNGKEPLELPYRVMPLEHFTIELRGANGKSYTIPRLGENVTDAKPGILTIPPGESETLSLHICHYMPQVGKPGEKFTVAARLKHGDKVYESKPLTVDE